MSAKFAGHPAGRPGGVKTRHWLFWLAIIIAVTQGIGLFLPDLLRPDVYADDACQHIWWTYRFADPGLFPNDYIADFFSRPIFAPYGFQAIYAVFNHWLDAQTLSELLPWFIAVPTLVLAWLIGRRTANGSVIGGFVAATFATVGILADTKGGFPRSFAPLILMLGVWALMARRHGWLGFAFLLAAFFYPQAGINLGLLAAVVLGWRFYHERRSPAGWIPLVVMGSLAMAMVASVYVRPNPPEIGRKIKLAEAKAMPELGAEGRSKFFDADPIVFYIEGKRSGIGFSRYKFLLVVALVIAGVWWRRGIVPIEGWALLGTSLAAFILAHLVLFTLHLPNRYISYTSDIFYMIFSAGFFASAWKAYFDRPQSAKLAGVLNRRGVHLAVLGIVGVAFLVSCIARCHSELKRPHHPDREAAFAFLETLPKDTRVAAHPVDASDIPLRSRRSVIASRETALPYYSAFYQREREAMGAEMTACFASDWADVAPLHAKYGADVFLVYTGRYHGARFSQFVQPFREAAIKAIERGQREGFVLEHPPADRILFAQGEYLVVSLKPGN